MKNKHTNKKPNIKKQKVKEIRGWAVVGKETKLFSLGTVIVYRSNRRAKMNCSNSFEIVRPCKIIIEEKGRN